MNPAIVDVECPQDPVIRRGLMNIAKIMQNLANNIFFGKELHMVPLNDFLSSNIINVTRYLSEINVTYLCHSSYETHTEYLLSRKKLRKKTNKKSG